MAAPIPASTPSAQQQLQVAGHPGGIISHDEGRKIIKKTSKYEARFYEDVQARCSSSSTSEEEARRMRRLQRLLPIFYGRTSSEGCTSSSTANGDAAAGTATRANGENGGDEEAEDVEIVLENLLQGYRHRNVLDVKLGKVLSDERASAEKRARMEANARDTTSWTDALRLTGWQMWDKDMHEARFAGKTFGKSIQSDAIVVGLRIYFGCATEEDWATFRKTVKGKERVFSAPPPRLPPAQVRRLLREHILPGLDEVEQALSGVELRMRAGSVLIVYEGGVKELDQALQESPSTSTEATGPIASVKLIDFAHTELRPGQGPDEDVLLGVRRLRGIVAEIADAL